MFILFTLDHWYAVLQDVWKVPEASRVFSSIYVILWLLLGSIIFRNIIVAMMGKSRESTTLHKGWWENWLTGVGGLLGENSVSRTSGCWDGYFTLFLPLTQTSWSSHHHLLTPNGPLGQLLTSRISEMSWVRRWPTWRFSIKLTYSSDRLFRGQLLCVQTPCYFSTCFLFLFFGPYDHSFA